MMDFAQRLSYLQKKKNIPKQELADKIGVSRMSYYRYESGERSPTADILIALADCFQVSIDYLVGRSDMPTNTPEFLSRFTAKNDEERELLRIFRAMMASNQQSLLDYAQYMKMKDQDEQKEKESIG